jgi:hypothetical protein
MYKVYFNNRTAFLGNDFSGIQENSENLVHKFSNGQELHKSVIHFSSSEQFRNLYLFHEDLDMLFKEFKSCFRVIEAGGGLVFNEKGDFLTIKRNGVWDLPKGKLEKKEDFETAALREVKEETGLKKLVIVQPLITTYHSYPLADKMVLKESRWFEMNYPGSKKPLLEGKEGITDHKWVKPGTADFILKNSYLSILDVLHIRKLL